MRIALVTAIFFYAHACFSQEAIIKKIIARPPVKETGYKPAQYLTESFFKIPCAYGSAELQLPDTGIDLNQVQIVSVDLVFTDHPGYDNLEKLNGNRLRNLFKKYPSVADPSIEWRITRQMDGAEREDALGMFHGFVIYYRPLQTSLLMETDIKKLKEMLVPEASAEIIKRRRGFVTGDTTELRKNYEIEEYVAVKKMPVTKALLYLGIDPREKITYKNYDSLFVYEKPLSDSTGINTEMKPPADSTVLKVLDRNQWNNMLVVTDVTASMYPYTGQLMIWLRFHEDERRIRQFIFFNDGDNRDDDTKIAGRTGGIYSSSSSVFEVIEQLAFKAMSNGSGGSIPENNIEALLYGLKACNDCESVIMIADNSSGASDMELLKQVNKPVHIILCGVHEEINTDYLDIARSTGGSVHLVEEDLSRLAAVKEGETISIHGKKYKIVNGKFVKE